MPKTLAEIAIEAGLVNKTSAAKAGRLAEERKEPLVVTLIKELGVDEIALIAAIRKQTRIPLLDPADIQIDTDALRQVSRDVCARLRVLPLALHTEGTTRILRLAMADPTDSTAVAEIEQITHLEIEVSALPLSAIDELVAKRYREIHTGTISRPGGTMFITSKGKLQNVETESEVSVTAQIPISALQQAVGTADLEAHLNALIQVLTAKGLVTEAELAEALRAPKPRSGA
ncbi:MAG: ral secretory system protein domain protein [Myxococcales bacterium]|nr:ral secretory system protein domain protein [Myxococcales bacterium]